MNFCHQKNSIDEFFRQQISQIFSLNFNIKTSVVKVIYTCSDFCSISGGGKFYMKIQHKSATKINLLLASFILQFITSMLGPKFNLHHL